jgi:hypothetical protein
MAVMSLSLCQPSSVAFFFDLISIGRSIFSGATSLKDLLESRIIKKITFDCRNDSNTLYHQYGISLTNCLDLQVFQLGIKIVNGSYSVFSGTPYLRGLRYVAAGHLTSDELTSSVELFLTMQIQKCGVNVPFLILSGNMLQITSIL